MHSKCKLFFLGLVLLNIDASLFADDEARKAAEASDEKIAPFDSESSYLWDSLKLWAPPIPEKDDADWIQLNSGEWLRGEIKMMQDKEIDFDSDKLHENTFDMEDVIYIRSGKEFEIFRTDKTIDRGFIEVTKDKVRVVDHNHNVTEFPRSDLSAFTKGTGKELDYWSASVTAGLSGRSGNSNSLDFNLQMELLRRTADTRLGLIYKSIYSENDNDTTANNQRATFTFDKFISDRSFISIPSIEYLKDPFQNISSRVTAGVGYGYAIIKKTHYEWDVVIGPAYQWTRFDSVLPGEDTSMGSGAIFLMTDCEIDITSRTTLKGLYRVQLTRSDVGGNIHHAEGSISVDITHYLELDVSVTWDRVQDPQQDNSGSMPKKDDYTISAGLKITF